MSRIYDSSYLTQRKMERATAGSFITQGGSRPLLGIKDQSIINTVKTGQMTEYSRYTGCIGISPGCPCNVTAILPSPVSGITFTIGSIIVSWNAPVGEGPFSYRITPYLNGVAQPFVSTSETSYRFTDVVDWQPYTFTICAFNGAGQGPDAYTGIFLAPPATLSAIMLGTPMNQDPLPSLQYILNAALDSFIAYVSSKNVGPTRGARTIYLWAASIAQAWNWVSADARISGTHDQWNWDQNPAQRGGAGTALTQNDSIVWMCSVIDYLTPYFIVGTYQSIYNCPADTVARVKASGQWDAWTSAWNTWYTARGADGSVAAGSALPTSSANWNQTIIVDGVTVNNIAAFPQPQQWTRLTVNGTKQGYLTYLWDNVSSTCLSEGNEASIQASVAPVTGAARDAEIDNILYLSENLNDMQKVIPEFWAGSDPGFHSPPLMLLWLWKEYMRTRTSLACSSVVDSLLDLAIHLFEGSRVTWRLKTAFMEARPIQEIRRRYAGQTLTYWKGTMDGSQWMPYQLSNAPTPPFADFPSGHSHFSKAFALTMNKWFGTTITKTSVTYDGLTLLSPIFSNAQTAAYGDFVISKGDSNIQVGITPSVPVTLSFNTWNEMANQAGISRLYGGIHAMSAHTASQSTAVSVDGFIQSAWNIRVGT